jgi:hypothetical protein
MHFQMEIVWNKPLCGANVTLSANFNARCWDAAIL